MTLSSQIYTLHGGWATRQLAIPYRPIEFLHAAL